MELYPDVPRHLYGKIEKQLKTKETEPTEEELGVPTSKAQYNEYLVELMKTGLNFKDATSDLTRRHSAFKEACIKYKAQNEPLNE